MVRNSVLKIKCNLSSESAINYGTIISAIAMRIKRATARNRRRKTSKLSSTGDIRRSIQNTSVPRYCRVRSSPRIYPLVFCSDIFSTLFLKQMQTLQILRETVSQSVREIVVLFSHSYYFFFTFLFLLLLREIKNRWKFEFNEENAKEGWI